MSRLAAHRAAELFASIGDRQARIVATVAVVICCALVWGLTRLTGVPAAPGYSGSLLSQPHPVWAMATAGIAFLLCVILSHRLATHGHHETGVFVAAISLMVVTVQCGPMRYVLFASPQPAIFLQLAFELFLLYAWVTVGWLLLHQLIPLTTPMDPIASGLAAMAIQAIVTAACVMFLAVSDQTPQTLFAVTLAAVVGSIVAHMTFPLQRDIWFWMGPLITGVVGYVMAWHNPLGIQIGFPQGSFGPLARPTPLAYASAGPAGALLGLWWARAWHEAEQPT